MPVSQIESHDKSPLFLNIIQIASCMQSIDVYGMEHEISGLRNHYFDSLLFRQAHAHSFPAWISSGACPLFPSLDFVRRMPTLSRLGFRQAHAHSFPASMRVLTIQPHAALATFASHHFCELPQASMTPTNTPK